MKKRARFAASLCVAVSLSAPVAGCGRGEEPQGRDDVLLAMGDSLLTMQDVVGRIPVGLAPADSAAIFRKIVAAWMEDMVLTDMAKSKLPDLEQIERRVSDYRNRLIIMSYLSMMRGNVNPKISEENIRSFYDAHHKEMHCERPLVKGILLKVPSSAGDIEEIKRCVFTATDGSLDELERKWATDALQYEYFNHTWVDWQSIAEQIPYRFFDPDAFLSSTKNFETVSGGTVYILHISDYLPSGSELPYEFAMPRITAILEQAKLSKYEDDLVESLIKKALADEKLVAVGYDPVSRRVIKRGEERNNESERDE